MSETKARSIRLDDDVMAAIDRLPGSTLNDKLRGLLIEKNAGQWQQSAQGEPDTRLDELLELVQGIAATLEREPAPEQWTHPSAQPSISELQQRINEMQGGARSAGLASDVNHCAHCRRDVPRPPGTRPSSICQECRTAGHWNTGNCPKCAEAAHLDGIAGQDAVARAAGRSDIEYDAAS